MAARASQAQTEVVLIEDTEGTDALELEAASRARSFEPRADRRSREFGAPASLRRLRAGRPGRLSPPRCCPGSPEPGTRLGASRIGSTSGIGSERKVPRLRKSLTLLLLDGWRGEVVDVSATGMRVRSVVVLAPHSELEGALVLEDGRQIPIAAVVVWTAPAGLAGAGLSEFGLELLRPSEQYLAAVAQLCADAS